MAESKAVEKAAEELHGLPPAEFTRARDARVKELRKEGAREAADAVKALRKPTVAAWALNQLARARSKDVERLLAAGKELRSAQEELLGGGDRAAFQEAAAAERELVAKLSADATALAGEAGERGTGLPEKVAATLHAAALDEDTAEELRVGRLVREREAIGGFGEAAAAAAATSPSASPATRRPKKAQARGKAAPRPDKDDARPTAARPSDKEDARPKATRPSDKEDARPKAAPRPDKDDASRRRRIAAARTDERHARRELDAAVRALGHAKERAEAAEAHAAEAAERARTTAERLKEARRAEAAARKAHKRAERALETVERGSAHTS